MQFDKFEGIKHPAVHSDSSSTLLQDATPNKDQKELTTPKPTNPSTADSAEKLFGKLTITDDAKGTPKSVMDPSAPAMSLDSASDTKNKPREYSSDEIIGRTLTEKQKIESVETGKVTADPEGEKHMGLQPLADWAKAENGTPYYPDQLISRPLTGRQMNQFLRNGTVTEDPEGEKAMGLTPLSDWIRAENGQKFRSEELAGRPLTVRQMNQYLRNGMISEDPEGEKAMHLQPLKEWIKQHSHLAPAEDTQMM